MKLEDAIAKAKITQADVAKILGKTPGNISTRLKKGSELLVSEMILIEDATGVSLYRDMRLHQAEYDQVAIPYLELPGINSSRIKSKQVQERVQFDKEIVENIWDRKPEDLRIMIMLGNSMNYGEYPLKNNDVLIIDIAARDTAKPGIYVYMANGEPFVAGLAKKANGNMQMIHINPDYPDEEYTPKELKEMDFKIIGRMLKNLSLTK